MQRDFERWKLAEQAALDAEEQVRAAGQMSASPQAVELLTRAAALRQEADELLETLRQSAAGSPAGKRSPDDPA